MREIEVLVVEDTPTDRMWLESVLQELGFHYHCSAVADGEKAVDFLLKRGIYSEVPTPDLIFLDVHLPKLNGMQILQRLPNVRHLPVCVVTSSEANRQVFEKEFGIHASDYLIKPVSPRVLLESTCVRRFLDWGRG